MSEWTLHPAADEISDEDFVDSAGGPMVILPTIHLGSWWGCYDAEGEYAYDREPTDYDRACDGSGFPFVIPLQDATDEDPDRWALVMEAPDASAFFRPPDGSLLVVRWVGAESTAGLVSAALGLQESDWESTGLTVQVPAGGLSLFDSGDDGRHPEEMEGGLAQVDLPEGRYAIDRVVEVNGVVVHPERREEVMTQLLRLRAIDG